MLARSAEGPVCFCRGARLTLCIRSPVPSPTARTCVVVLRGLTDLMAMPSVGDLVIYGVGAPGGHVSYVAEIGAHAGTCARGDEHVHHASEERDGAAPLVHPLQLYDHFTRYQD